MKSPLCFLLLTGAALAQASAPVKPAPLPPQPAPSTAATPIRPAITPRIVPLSEEISEPQTRLELARALFYLQRFPESLAEYEKVLAVQKDDVAIQAEYAEVAYRAGKTTEAAAIFARLAPDKIPRAQKLALAELLIAQNKFTEAAAIYAQCVREQPGDLVARFREAEVLSWLKRYDESLAIYRELLAQRPDDVQLRRRYALTLLWAGKLEDAAAEMRRTLPGV